MTPQQKTAAVSAAVLALATPVVTHFEGEVRHGYRDPIGLITYCVGHLAKPGETVKATYTHEECALTLRKDLADHDAGIQSCVTVDMPPEVHAAMLSFTFNVGVAAFCKSTAAALLNARNWAGACAQLKRWTMAGGKILPGLVARRQAEYDLCMDGA